MTEDGRKKVAIGDLDKCKVLAILYNTSQPQGRGFIHYDPSAMTRDQAKEILDSGQTRFDYLKGRVMKLDLNADSFDPDLYDRDNGENAAATAIDRLRNDGNVNSEETVKEHVGRVRKMAAAVHARLGDTTKVEITPSCTTLELGFDDVADELGPKVAQALDRIDKI